MSLGAKVDQEGRKIRIMRTFLELHPKIIWAVSKSIDKTFLFVFR